MDHVWHLLINVWILYKINGDFIYNCKLKVGRKKVPISTNKFNDAEKAFLCNTQHQEFSEEVNTIKGIKP